MLVIATQLHVKANVKQIPKFYAAIELRRQSATRINSGLQAES